MQRGGRGFERQARGVGREHRVGAHARLGRRVQRPLGVQVLEDRLDDDVGLGDAAAVDVGAAGARAACARSAGVDRRFSNRPRARASAGSM